MLGCPYEGKISPAKVAEVCVCVCVCVCPAGEGRVHEGLAPMPAHECAGYSCHPFLVGTDFIRSLSSFLKTLQEHSPAFTPAGGHLLAWQGVSEAPAFYPRAEAYDSVSSGR